MVYAKERRLIEECKKEIAAGRLLQVFAVYTQKRDVTLVLRGTIALSRTRFPRGTLSPMLDAIARVPLDEHASIASFARTICRKYAPCSNPGRNSPTCKCPMATSTGPSTLP